MYMLVLGFAFLNFPWNAVPYFAAGVTSAGRLLQHCPGRQRRYPGHGQICPGGWARASDLDDAAGPREDREPEAMQPCDRAYQVQPQTQA
jgi:hypothetical protein